MPQVVCNVLLDDFPTVTETTNESNSASVIGQAPGSDAILAVIYRVVSPHVEEGEYPTRILGCIYNPPVQAERKCSSLWQPQGNLSIVDCCEDTGKNPTESPEWASWSGWASTRKSVWSQKGQRNNRHNLYSKASQREMWTSTWPLSTLRKHSTQSAVMGFGKL